MIDAGVDSDNSDRGPRYNTFLGKGAKHSAVMFEAQLRKRSTETLPDDDVLESDMIPQDLLYKFTAPSTDMNGIDLYEYFTPPSRAAILEAATAKDIVEEMDAGDDSGTGLVARSHGQHSCTRDFTSARHYTEDYETCLRALGVTAAATVSGWGQSATISGDFLSQAKFLKSTLTYVITMELNKQQNFTARFLFNDGLYNQQTFASDFGDRWIRGFQTGGKMMVRVSIKSKEEGNKREIKAFAEAALSFWGVRGDISAHARENMKKLDRKAKIDMSIHYQGEVDKEILNASSGTDKASSVEDQFMQVKTWSDSFIHSACEHDYRYQIFLDEYNNLENFPRTQPVPDYDIAHRVSFVVLKERVKVSEMSQLLRKCKAPRL
ncbi:hypothetical protein CDD82_3118 [Ophiocordyceps australis]|uniref:MACPF domain-containing protein n=1 Tax=Ophiocordyceps australis TaxID=1399860 RepID=A0A2C5ZTN8_9HYPO|nr:hypothetical protein CDD82_3118 [Ophiocordyceps australis]